MKKSEKDFFPILLTHLDPSYFNHFCFNKHQIKVHYIKPTGNSIGSNPLLTLINKRDDASIKENVSKYFFHFHPESVNIVDDFENLVISKEWGESGVFQSFIKKEVDLYLNNEKYYNPLAICFGVRIKIEELAYLKIEDQNRKNEFLSTKGTDNKLNFCEENGVPIPDIHYLLGLIYNHSLHPKKNDIIKPLFYKLENCTIKKLIARIFVRN